MAAGREVTTVLSVDSRHRDTAAYPRPDDYVLALNNGFRNVSSVELVYALYPTSGTEPYVNLFVRELEGGLAVASGAAEAVYGAFTQLPMLDPVNEYSSRRHFRSVCDFRVPLGRLTRLSIRFSDATGAAYPVGDHFLRFEVRCCARAGVRDSDYVQRLSGGAAGPRDALGLGSGFDEAQLKDAYNSAAERYRLEQRAPDEAEALKLSFLALLGEARARAPRRKRGAA